MTVIVKKSSRTVISVLLTLCLIAGLMIGLGGFKGKAELIGDNYPHSDNYGFAVNNCTSFVAWRMNTANGVQFNNWTVDGKSVNVGCRGGGRDGGYCSGGKYHLCHGKNWGTTLRKMGYTVDMNPAVGSIAWEDTSDSSRYGHVAWVAAVNGNSVTVEEYNYASRLAYHVRTVDKSKFSGFIHVKDIAPQKNADPGQQTIFDGRYHIVSQINDNFNLDVVGVSKDAGANIWLWQSRNTPEQTFNVRWLGNGYYKIINANSGKALELSGANPNAGANVHQWNEHEGEAEQWVIRANADGSYSIIARWGNHTLDVYNGIAENGTNIQVWDNNNSAAQNFYFVEYAGQTIKDGRYYISPKNDTSLVLAVAGQSKNNAANIEIYSKSSRKGHTWDVKHLGNGYYSIINTNSKLSLDVANANRGNAVNVQQMPFVENNNAQQWIIKANGDGSYRIIAKCGGRNLDVSGGKFANGTNVQMYNRNGMDAQNWVFTEYIPPVDVKLDPNGGYWRANNSTAPKTISAEVGKNTSLSGVGTLASNDHKVFAGWSEKKNDSSGNYKTSITTDKAVTLYAQWKDVDPAKAIIILDGNGGYYNNSGSMIFLGGESVVTVTDFNKGEVLPASATSEGGYFHANSWRGLLKRFDGWYKDKESTQAFNPKKDIIPGDITLYANWKTDTNPFGPTPSEPDEPTPSEPHEPTPSEPDEPTPSEPDGPTPSEPDKPTPSEPDKPTPTPTPVVKQNGLADSEDKDGNWWFYKDGKIDKTHNGVDQNKYGWWRVENGKVNFNAQGIYKNGFGWWKTTNGKVTFKEEGVFQNNFGWWRVKDSKVDFNAQSIFQGKVIKNGKVQ